MTSEYKSPLLPSPTHKGKDYGSLSPHSDYGYKVMYIMYIIYIVHSTSMYGVYCIVAVYIVCTYIKMDCTVQIVI